MVSTTIRHRAVAMLFVLALAVLPSAFAFAQPAAPADPAGAPGPSGPDASQVLVDGTPPLTTGVLHGVTQFLEWLLDVQFTDKQRTEVQASTVEAWTSKSQEDMDNVLQMVQFHGQLPDLKEEDRAFYRQALQDQVLTAAREDPEEESNAWILAVYNSAHTPLAAGPPALTRQMTDAFAELLAFMISEVTGQPGILVDQAMKDEFATTVGQQWPDLAAEDKERYTMMPLLWATLRAGWPGLADEDRTKLREGWSEQFKAYLPQQTAQTEPVAEPAAVAEGTVRPLPSNDAAGYAARGRQYLENSDWDLAIADFTQVLRFEPNSVATLLDRGKAYSGKGERDLTINDYTRAADLDPKSVEAQKGLYQAYMAKDAMDQAKAHWTKMKELQGVTVVDGMWALEMQQRIAASQAHYQMMSNILRMQHETSMTIINNIGGWNTQYRYY